MEMAVPLSPNKKQQYRKLFAKLRKRKSSKDDQMISFIHDDVFAQTDCLTCANCCKTHSPLFVQKDVERISNQLKMRPADFVAKYLILDEDGDWIFPTVPCPFLGTDNFCSIYPDRPEACREYPHTNRKKLYTIEEITLKNAEICPAVVKILDKIEISLQKN